MQCHAGTCSKLLLGISSTHHNLSRGCGCCQDVLCPGSTGEGPGVIVTALHIELHVFSDSESSVFTYAPRSINMNGYYQILLILFAVLAGVPLGVLCESQLPMLYNHSPHG